MWPLGATLDPGLEPFAMKDMIGKIGRNLKGVSG